MTRTTDPEQLLARVRAARAAAPSNTASDKRAETVERQLLGTSFRGDYDQTAEILASGTIDADGETATEEAREAQQEAARNSAARREESYEEVRDLVAPPSAGNPLDPFDLTRHILREAGLIHEPSNTDHH